MKLRKLLIKTGILAALLALMLAFAPAAFAEPGSLTLTSAPGSSQDSSGSGTGSTTTTGTTGASENTASAEEGESEEELERRKEIYTMVALITLGAILVGIRDKKRR